TIHGIDPEALARLGEYPWPGNVRELQNVIERSVILCESDIFTLDPSWPESDSLDELHAHSTSDLPVRRRESIGTLKDIQYEAILRALRSCNWVIGGPRGAASVLGIKRTTLQARIRRLGIDHLRPGLEEPSSNRAVTRVLESA